MLSNKMAQNLAVIAIFFVKLSLLYRFNTQLNTSLLKGMKQSFFKRPMSLEAKFDELKFVETKFDSLQFIETLFLFKVFD